MGLEGLGWSTLHPAQMTAQEGLRAYISWYFTDCDPLSPHWYFVFLTTWLVFFFSCLIALVPNPIEALSWLIYTEQLFRPKADGPFSQMPLCYPVSLLFIVKCFILNAHYKEAVLKCMQQMMVSPERMFRKLREPKIIIRKCLPSKRQAIQMCRAVRADFKQIHASKPLFALVWTREVFDLHQ